MNKSSDLPANHQRRARVGVDFHVWDGIFQGSRSHLLGLYKAVIPLAEDIDFVFFLGDVDSLRRQHPEFASSNVTLVSMPSMPGVLRLAAQLPWMQWRYKLDLLHVQYRLPFLRMGPCACTIHDVLFETHPQFFSRSFVAQSRLTCASAARNSAVLFSVSEFSQREILRFYGPNLPEIFVTYNGVDTARFKPQPEGQEVLRELGLESGQYLLTIGRLEPRKNHGTLIEAFARLPQDGPPLVIIGQRDFNYESIFMKVQEYGLTERVKLLERVDDQALPVILGHARLFVYPAFAEGFGMPVVEAMASGVPVVTSSTTSLPEVVGGAALMVDPGSVSELADAMGKVLADDALRRDMVARGLEQASRFSWHGSAVTFLGAVRSFLKNRV